MKIQDVFNKIIESKAGCFSGAGFIFFDGNKVLLLKNLNKCWGFPGGKPDEGEVPEETARRESIEEIGSCPGVIMKEISFKNDSRTFYSYVSLIEKTFDIKISEEHTEFKWVDYTKLKRMRLQKYVYKFLDKIVKELNTIKEVEFR